MESQLHQALGNLCLNTGWKYAVFWKLKHLSKTLFTWEDTYYDNDDYQQSNDALSLALAEMSYHAYSLGEGVVGHVALTGKHLWICADKCANDSSFFFHCFEGWQKQYLAGIKTVAVVAVIPHGVVQLGSLDDKPEDLSIVDKVREAIYELQHSFLASESLMPWPCRMLDISIKPPIPLSYHGISHSSDRLIETCAPENVNDAVWSGCELSEALGPAFRKQNTDIEWSSGDIETDKTTQIVAESMLIEHSETSHNLLEAVVKKNLESDISSNRENRSETCSSIGSFSGLNSSGSFAVPYSKSISSNSCSMGSETLLMSRESRNIHKKRAKPGVNCRPKPRDRQLIQDRIKVLRELVPNGSKCSIDSLLERTIKHTIFMKSIIKQAEKLNLCIKTKSLGKEPRIKGASDEGSSWAVEIDNLKACPIIVENVNMHGQILVEMMCGDGSRFLEISEAIRSMGLTILKGDTEPSGEKTWIRFVVQDEKNRRLRRVDILWSLIQLLQAN